ncbi:phosphatase PAP2 family protein [Metasolibacillus sp. FSL H7-0170]|uniref:phosphatase PAP2 family protein n=1 Tax=Metasolibacillus TaxID=2703677 RepID=UPI000795AB3A|nr:phosphatase PAP2 family protein [Metasolibacillus fluoroglycofenilyticus]KYG89670.1 phosphatidylglycerophosphatase [[Bacillus] sp. KCTC 13219]
MKKWIYGLAIVTLSLFIMLRFTYETPSFINFDDKWAQLLRGNELLIFFHYIGEPIFVVIVALILVIWQWRKGNYDGVAFIVLTIAVGNVLNQLLKKWIERPRPDMVDQLLSFSFPSGHSMTGALYLLTIAYLLSEGLNRSKKALLIWAVALILICLIGLSRIAESRHFATDVLAGWSMGYTWFIVCMLWYERRKRAKL